MTTEKSNEPLRWSGKDWLLLGVNAALFMIMYILFNEQLPEIVGTHFNFRGEQDDTMTKAGFWLLNGSITVGLPVLLSVARYIDPRRNNYTRFAGYYYLIRWSISLFLQAVLFLVILINLGYEIPVPLFVLGSLGILWMVLGNRMSQLRSNFFVGIKTPWALTDETNWKLTHRLSGRLWFIAGLIMFASAFFLTNELILPVLIVCVLASSLVPYVYSYLLYKRK